MKPDIKAIEDRAEKAAKGPCAVLSSVAEGGDPSDTWFIKAQPHPAMRGFTKDIAMVEGMADAEFIGAAYSDIPALLTYIKELERQVERKDAALEKVAVALRNCESLAKLEVRAIVLAALTTPNTGDRNG